MLHDLAAAALRRMDLGLGNVDEELSTVTKENKPHFGAWSFEDKLLTHYASLQFKVQLSKLINLHLALCYKLLLTNCLRLKLHLWLLNALA